jgi:hypothetical protein
MRSWSRGGVPWWAEHKRSRVALNGHPEPLQHIHPQYPIKLQSMGTCQHHGLNIRHPKSPKAQLGNHDHRDLEQGAVSRDDCSRATGMNGEV